MRDAGTIAGISAALLPSLTLSVLGTDIVDGVADRSGDAVAAQRCQSARGPELKRGNQANN